MCLFKKTIVEGLRQKKKKKMGTILQGNTVENESEWWQGRSQK